MQHGAQLTVEADLVDTADGSQIWTGRYNRDRAEILQIQDDIVSHISRGLHLQNDRNQQNRLSKHHTESPEAYELYLRGRHFLHNFDENGFTKSLEYFKQALDVDAQCALAYAGMADVSYHFSNMLLPPHEAMPRSRAAALKALEIDDTLAEAHASLAVVKSRYEWDWSGAEREFRRSLQLNPGYAPAHHGYGLHLISMGRAGEAAAELNRARDLDPLSCSIAVTAVWPWFYAPPSARRYDRAAEELRSISALDAKCFSAHALLAGVYGQQGCMRTRCARLKPQCSSPARPVFSLRWATSTQFPEIPIKLRSYCAACMNEPPGSTFPLTAWQLCMPVWTTHTRR